MSNHPKRPLRRQLLAQLMRIANVPMRWLLRFPFPTPFSERLMLVSFTGRRTGKRYQQPVSYVRQGDVLLSPGGGNWKWNLEDGKPVQIWLGGRDVVARPELVKDPDEIEHLLGIMIATNPAVRAFVGIPRGSDGRLDRNRVEMSVHYGFRIVCWHLGEEQPRPTGGSESG